MDSLESLAENPEFNKERGVLRSAHSGCAQKRHLKHRSNAIVLDSSAQTVGNETRTLRRIWRKTRSALISHLRLVLGLQTCKQPPRPSWDCIRVYWYVHSTSSLMLGWSCGCALNQGSIFSLGLGKSKLGLGTTNARNRQSRSDGHLRRAFSLTAPIVCPHVHTHGNARHTIATIDSKTSLPSLLLLMLQLLLLQAQFDLFPMPQHPV